MASDSLRSRAMSSCCLAAMLAGCAAPEPMPEPLPAIVLPAPPPAPAPAPPAQWPSSAGQTPAHALDEAVAYAERVRGLTPPEVAQEIQRLGDTSYSPLRATQLALALAQSRTAASSARAQALLQRVQADPGAEAKALQSLARVLSAQIAEQRRADETAERQGQQLREAQRRIDQLNERLEAVRAIERSLVSPTRRDPTRP